MTPAEEKAAVEKGWQNGVDGLADFHSRLSDLETWQLNLARKVSQLEEHNRGHYDADDPMKQMLGLGGSGSMIWIMVLLGIAAVVVPVVPELIRSWRSGS